MTLPVKHDDSAEQVLGTTSLEMVRGRVIRNINKNPDLNLWQRWRTKRELDFLIRCEQARREQSINHQLEIEELEHKHVIVQKQADISQKHADIVSKLRLLQARTDRAVARYQRDCFFCKLDVIERVLHLRAKYKSVENQDDHLKEILKIKRQQKLFEAREQAILDSITKRAMNRATFIKMVNDKFPDMVDELTDFYDQQIFQQGTRR